MAHRRGPAPLWQRAPALWARIVGDLEGTTEKERSVAEVARAHGLVPRSLLAAIKAAGGVKRADSLRAGADGLVEMTVRVLPADVRVVQAIAEKVGPGLPLAPLVVPVGEAIDAAHVRGEP